MELLLSDSEHSNNIEVSNKITVLPIVGMGGVGKTTLAQCIYNDPRICQYFDLRRWIYVSEDFDLVRLTREIYRSITNKPCKEDFGFDHLQDSIKKELMRFKRTFLVLDDVWNEERCLWESLQIPFHGAGSVTILMTTRNEKVANIMRTMNSFHLVFLSEEEGWRLFQKHALCDDVNLIKIGQGIVRKCGGFMDLWLSELRILAYDIDNIVDEYEYEVLRAQIQAKLAEEAYHRRKRKRGDDNHPDENEWGEGRNILESSSSQVPSIPDGMAEKLREIRERFDEIERHRKALQLREEEGVRRSIATWKPRPTSSLVDETSIIGREGDKEKLMELLLSDLEHSNNIQVSNKITVLPIVGMGGVGKTTLAQCIYNDPRICQYFDLRRWIYVSEDFDLVRLTKEIYRSITNKSCEDVGFDQLQDSIKKELMKFKRTFLVLDDVWNEQRCFWESLQALLHGADIVTILMTTRNEKVANVMRTMNSFHLGMLSKDEGLRLFQQRALCDDENLMKIGQKIVIKCRGLPLAIKLLGSHLRFERDEDKWMSILESELWELDPGVSEILPALRLSYQRMPVHLKPCFRYFSIFSKNEVLFKKHVVWLWVAQGYIQPKTAAKTVEETGREYFDELLGRSFLQVIKFKNNSFRMHDLIYDLAVSISSKEFITLTLEDDNQSKFASNNIRHLVVSDQRTHNGTQEDTLLYPFLSRHIALRSIFYHGRSIINDFQLLNSIRLRVLHVDIQEYDSNMSKFLDSIFIFKHLRYLYIQNAKAGFFLFQGAGHLSFFNSFHGVCNVQSLELFDRTKRLMLRASINHLINLRHLILPYKSFMPCGISKLTSLQTLKYVIVKNGSHECRGLSEIEELESLAGSCRISDIHYATDVGEVRKANFNKKKHISSLCLNWSDKRDGDISFDVDIWFGKYDSAEAQRSELAEAMLEALQPHKDLKEVKIQNYPGIRFPLWLGDPSYSKVRDITLHGCNTEWDGSCRGLDRYLPRVQSISIISCAKLKILNIVQSSTLRNLIVKKCPELSTLHGLCDLRKLEKLEIRKCYKLLISVEERLPSKLQSVCFEDCWKLTSITGLQNLHCLEQLRLSRCPKLQLSLDEQLTIMPGVVKVSDCLGLREWCHRFGFEFIQELSKRKETTIRYCDHIDPHYGFENLLSLETLFIHNYYGRGFPKDEWIPCNLFTLHLRSCQKLKFFPPYRNLSTLRLLKIRDCTALTYLSGLQTMECLKRLEILDCPQFMLSPVQRLPSKLQYLQISNCPRLMWLPGLQQLFSLRELRLYECRELMFLPLQQLPFMHQVQLEIINCPKLGEWCRRYNINYNNKESHKVLFASNSQQINLWLEETSVPIENICVLEYDEDKLEIEKWPAYRLLGFYVCFCVHLSFIHFSHNFNRLKKLRLWNCSNLILLFGLPELTSLQVMDISKCPKLASLNSIPSNLACLSGYFAQVPSLRFLKINKCPKLSLANEMQSYPPPYVEIRACPQLQDWCRKHHIAYIQD